MKILKFISDVRVCTNEDIQQAFFKGLNMNICYRRLNYLIDCKLVKRSYFNVGKNKNIYIYYLDKKPSVKILSHELLITKFLVNLMNEGYEILEFEKSPMIATIIPDAIVKIKTHNDKIKHIFFEAQLQPKDCILKYSNIHARSNKETPDTLYIVTNQKIIIHKIRGLNIILDDLNFSKINIF